DPPADAKIGEAVVSEPLRHVPKRRVERRGVLAREIDKDKAAPGADGHLEERVGRLVEVHDLHLPRRADELAIQAVRPGVIGTDDAPAGEPALLLGAEDRATVAARVVERLEPALEIADDHDALGPDPDDLVVPGRGDFLLASGHHPHAVPEDV